MDYDIALKEASKSASHTLPKTSHFYKKPEQNKSKEAEEAEEKFEHCEFFSKDKCIGVNSSRATNCSWCIEDVKDSTKGHCYKCRDIQILEKSFRFQCTPNPIACGHKVENTSILQEEIEKEAKQNPFLRQPLKSYTRSRDTNQHN